MELLSIKLQAFSVDQKKLTSFIRQGADEFSAKCTEPKPDPAIIFEDVVDVLLDGIDTYLETLQDSKVDPLIGNVCTSLTEDEMRELEEAEASNDSFLLVSNTVIDLEEDSKENPGKATTPNVKSPQANDLRSIFDQYNLPAKVTKTSIRLLNAAQVRQLTREITSKYPEFNSKYLKVTNSKSIVPTKENCVDAITAIAKNVK